MARQEERLAILEVKVETLTRMVEALASGESGRATVLDSDEATALGLLTTKQHKCLQMLLLGATNPEIAERFSVSINTVKVFVRTIAQKFGVTSRSQIVMKAARIFEQMPDDVYVGISGGVPKNWAKEGSNGKGKKKRTSRNRT